MFSYQMEMYFIQMYFHVLVFLFLHVVRSSSYFVSNNSVSQLQTAAVENLIKRMIGEVKAASFQVTVVASNDTTDKDWFSLEKKYNFVLITANSGVAAAYGFHFYLKNYCNCHISWDYDQLNLPNNLPDVKISVSSLDLFRYYQNVCVYSYSYVWWKWSNWEREIDWMALNGFNLALAFVGQESIWLRIYRRLNMTNAEINAHFAGPAFLAWARMGNIRGWGGPLTQEWQDESSKLQRKILSRMTEFGIIQILPAFCGFVPRAFKRLFPNAKMIKLHSWVNFSDEFCCPYLLDPSEPLFQVIGEMFMQELKNEFGLTHFYSCDTFNENRPQTGDLSYLANMASIIYRTIRASDSAGKWILQGWMFANDEEFWTQHRVKHFLRPVPDDRMIILDLQSELKPQYVRLKSYFGKPFIWCMLHNFGGTLGMHGSFDILNVEIRKARNLPNSTLIGIGLTPEGIHQNYVMYDFMTEVGWRNSSVDLNSWIKKYALRRYSKWNTNAAESWMLLKRSVYNYSRGDALHGQYALCVRPNLKLKPQSWYNCSDLYRAWDSMVSVSDTDILENSNFKHDLIDLTRQVFQSFFDKLYGRIVENYLQQNVPAFISNSNKLLNILEDMDLLLSTSSRFMLGSWIREAEQRGNSPAERINLIMNAKNQITLWGPRGEILDYATKQWSGVVRDYYQPRWRLFFMYLYLDMTGSIPFQQKIFDHAVFSLVEQPFIFNSKKYPYSPQNDSLKIINLLHNKWKNVSKWIV